MLMQLDADVSSFKFDAVEKCLAEARMVVIKTIVSHVSESQIHIHIFMFMILVQNGAHKWPMVNSNMAQRKRAGLITRRTSDRNRLLIVFFAFLL